MLGRKGLRIPPQSALDPAMSCTALVIYRAVVVQNVLAGQTSQLPPIRDSRGVVAFSKASFRLHLMGRYESDGSGDLSAIGETFLDSAARPGSPWHPVVLPA